MKRGVHLPSTEGGAILIRLTLIVPTLALLVWGLFTVAGRWDWLEGWRFLVLFVGANTASTVIVWRYSPALLRARAQIGAGTKTWDFVLLTLFGVSFLASLGVGALDTGRHHWSSMPAWVWSAGAFVFVSGHTLTTWAMLANPFFEKTVRIQTERNHTVAEGGPYGYIRHPGYLGVILSMVVAPPLLLGSWWACVPCAFTGLVLAIRTALEDRTLIQELRGYRSYSRRVRERLVPGIW